VENFIYQKNVNNRTNGIKGEKERREIRINVEEEVRKASR
jgi:hypothetical protein